MAQPREKPWLKNKNQLDKTADGAPPGGKKPELLVFDFAENNDPEEPGGSSPRKQADDGTPRDTPRKADNGGLESNRSPRQQDAAGDKPSPRGGPPPADDRSPRAGQGSPRKGDTTQRDGYEADSSDSNDKPAPAAARRGRDQSPEKRDRPGAAGEMNGSRRPKQSDASPRPPQPYERTARNTFTGKSTLSL